MRLSGFPRLALVTTLATYLLILVGALVRASGAGLGCPDWPRCFGSFIPPLRASQIPPEFDVALFNVFDTWTEYLNRLLGVVIGFLILATLISAHRHFRDVARVYWPTVAAFILVVFEGWLGAKVVDLELSSWIVTVHLVVALIIVSLLLNATVNAIWPERHPEEPVTSARLRSARLAWGLFAFALGQVAVGTFVRGSIEDAVGHKQVIPRAEWMQFAGALDIPHRQLALVLLVATLALVVEVRRSHSKLPALRRVAMGALALCIAQIVVGLVLAYAQMPAVAQVLHLSLASLYLGALTLIALLAHRLPRTDDEVSAELRVAASS